MPVFSYKATAQNHQIVEGTVSARSDEEVAQILKKDNLSPITIKAIKTVTKTGNSLPAIEKITFCRYISTMITSGLALTEGIPVLKKETKHPLMKQILDDIIYHLEQGQPLSTALKAYPSIFDTFFITLVKAGEVSGTLGESFKYLETQLRSDYSLSQKIKSALLYPGIIFTAMIGIGFLMFFFILPQIGGVFLRMTIPLPTVTEKLFTYSIAAAQYKYVIISLTVVAAVGGVVFFTKPYGKKLLIKFIAPIPIVSHMLRQIDIARFCRIFSTLLASAVPIMDAIEIALSSMTHPKFKDAAAPIINKVKQGKTVAFAFSQNNAFPPLLVQMITAGEKSGSLDVALSDLAEFYEQEVEEAVKKSTQLVEPILMMGVGIGVGAMILAIIAPMYSVVGNLQDAATAR